MTAQVIDGRKIAAELRRRVAAEAARLHRGHGIVPGLAVMLVGNDPASESYIASKKKAVAEAGMASFDHRLPADASEAEVLAQIATLNADPAVSGILVQLPLPPHIDAARVIAALDPAKDVDGFHPLNVGLLASGFPALAPCTPQGCIALAKSVRPTLAGLNAVVLGRSNIVGRPLAALLVCEDATVTVAHSRSRDLPAICRNADLLFAAVGKPELVRGDWVRMARR
jgi:methylenetetrahydrofolate dehydrogenase (NADP+)/methenyltetrahydrofolate cyclohydrolase